MIFGEPLGVAGGYCGRLFVSFGSSGFG